MVDGLRRGFATATTDTGTAPASPLEGDALIGQPRKWRDWARLSTHAMTTTGKAITKSFYGRDAERSYYTGCSTGSKQGDRRSGVSGKRWSVRVELGGPRILKQ